MTKGHPHKRLKTIPCYFTENEVKLKKLFLWTPLASVAWSDFFMDNTSRKISPKIFLFFLLILVLLCVLALYLQSQHRQEGSIAEVYQNGSLVETLPLDTNCTRRYDSADGGYNLLIIENGKVQIAEADCTDQVCVRRGATNQTADPIVCLPHQLVVEVKSSADENSSLDGVS